MFGKIRAFFLWLWSPVKKSHPVEDIHDERFTSISPAQAEAMQRKVEQERQQMQATKKQRQCER
jgi:hypothetical protein